MRRKKWLLISILAAVVLLAFVGCQAQTFTVAFDTDGGSAIASLTVEKGKEIECPAEPESRATDLTAGTRTKTGQSFLIFQMKKSTETQPCSPSG